jgi:hypothetical protein
MEVIAERDTPSGIGSWKRLGNSVGVIASKPGKGETILRDRYRKW